MSKYMKELPQDNEAKKSCLNAVGAIVDAMLEMDSLKDVIKDQKTYVQDKYGVDGSYIEGIAKIKYDLKYNERKKAEKILADAELVEMVESMS